MPPADGEKYTGSPRLFLPCVTRRAVLSLHGIDCSDGGIGGEAAGRAWFVRGRSMGASAAREHPTCFMDSLPCRISGASCFRYLLSRGSVRSFPLAAYFVIMNAISLRSLE